MEKNENVLQLPPTQPTHTDIFLRKPRSAQDRDVKSGVIINHFYFFLKRKQTNTENTATFIHGSDMYRI